MDTMWCPDLSTRRGPLYRAIADALADDIAAGRLPVGTRLPTHRALAERLEVTVGTITRAYAEAERRGLVDATVGRGTFVRDAAEWGPDAWSVAADTLSPCLPSLSPVRRAPASFELQQRKGGGGADSGRPTAAPVDLTANYPIGSLLGPALQPGLAAMAQDPERLNQIAAYQAAQGHPDHRAAGAAWLERFGVGAHPDEIVVTPGAQRGLDVVFAALCRPGETVLIEDLTWPGMHLLAQMHQLRLAPVAMDADGLRPDALAEAARRCQARLVYCMPTLHNPTNITMPETRRRELLEVAAAEGLTIVEDDVYGFLSETPQRPMASLDPATAIYVTSLSKSVAPGLRIGFVKAPRGVVPRVAAALRATTLMASPVSAELAAQLIRSGQAAAAAAQQHAAARNRQELARALFAPDQIMAATGSFHVWLKLQAPWQSASFVREALARGVAVTPGDVFTADGHDPSAVRLCLCAVSERATLERALGQLAALAQSQPESTLPVV